MSEQLLVKYEVLVKDSLDKYVRAYKLKYPDSRNIDTAKEFMEENYDSYRREVAGIGIDIIHEAGLGNNEVARQIIDKNRFSIGALFGEIMNDALGI